MLFFEDITDACCDMHQFVFGINVLIHSTASSLTVFVLFTFSHYLLLAGPPVIVHFTLKTDTCCAYHFNDELYVLRNCFETF